MMRSAAGACACSLPSRSRPSRAGEDRDPVVARHAGRAGERGQRDRAKFTPARAIRGQAVSKALPDTLTAAMPPTVQAAPARWCRSSRSVTRPCSPPAPCIRCPAHEDNGITVDWSDISRQCGSYYSSGGNLYSMASLVGASYYNKDSSRRPDLPTSRRRPWDEVESMAKKAGCLGRQVRLQQRVAVVVLMETCTRSTTSRSPITTTATTARHQPQDQRRLRREDDGSAGAWLQGRLVRLNGRLLRPRPTWPRRVRLSSRRRRRYPGLTRASDGKFTWARPLPKMSGFPQGNAIIGGASLWVLKGAKAEEYKACPVLQVPRLHGQPGVVGGVTGYCRSRTPPSRRWSLGHFQKSPQAATAITS